MRRNKNWAVKLLSFIEAHDLEGIGLTRFELRKMFANDKESSGMDTFEIFNVVDYHLSLLESANFVMLKKDEEDKEADDFMLTWSGHDQIER